MENDILKVEKKLLWSSRIRTILLGIITAMVVFGVITVVKNVKSFNDTVNELGTEVTGLAAEFKGEIVQKIDDLQLEQVDLEKVNAAVDSLKEAANNLSEVDVDNLNELVKELENVAGALSKATDGIKKIFGK